MLGRIHLKEEEILAIKSSSSMWDWETEISFLFVHTQREKVLMIIDAPLGSVEKYIAYDRDF